MMPLAVRHSCVVGVPPQPTLPCDVVLCHRCACNHDCCWILYLHLPQQHVAVLCELDVCCGGRVCAGQQR